MRPYSIDLRWTVPPTIPHSSGILSDLQRTQRWGCMSHNLHWTLSVAKKYRPSAHLYLARSTTACSHVSEKRNYIITSRKEGLVQSQKQGTLSNSLSSSAGRKEPQKRWLTLFHHGQLCLPHNKRMGCCKYNYFIIIIANVPRTNTGTVV